MDVLRRAPEVVRFARVAADVAAVALHDGRGRVKLVLLSRGGHIHPACISIRMWMYMWNTDL